MKKGKKRNFTIEVSTKPRLRGGRKNTNMDNRPKRLRTRKSRNMKAIKEFA